MKTTNSVVGATFENMLISSGSEEKVDFFYIELLGGRKS